jgi:tRNA(adenine34) deaminase
MSTPAEQSDEFFMSIAINLAQRAAAIDEVPVGALVVLNNKIIGRGINRRETLHCATSHAEINAIQQANNLLGQWRLNNCHLYSTLEPCVMCAGAIIQARLEKVIIGTPDPKAGAMGSIYNCHSDQRLNHQVEIKTGILQDQCSRLMSSFFQKKRLSKNRL